MTAYISILNRKFLLVGFASPQGAESRENNKAYKLL